MGSSLPAAWQAYAVTSFHERLYLPLSWWIRTLVLVAVVWWVFAVGTTMVVALVATILTAAGLCAGLARYGGAEIAVADGWLVAGRASIDLSYCGEARVLDAEQWRAQMGPRADARAYLMSRAYIDTGVLVTINDPHDSTPYWMLSSRHPDRLVAALGDPHREAE